MGHERWTGIQGLQYRDVRSAVLWPQASGTNVERFRGGTTFTMASRDPQHSFDSWMLLILQRLDEFSIQPPDLERQHFLRKALVGLICSREKFLEILNALRCLWGTGRILIFTFSKCYGLKLFGFAPDSPHRTLFGRCGIGKRNINWRLLGYSSLFCHWL